MIAAADYQLAPSSHDPFMLDRLGKLLQNQDKMVVSTPREKRREWAFLLKSAGVHGRIVSEPAHALGAMGGHRYEQFDCTTLVVSTGPLGLRAQISKRLFDLVITAGAVIALSPLMLIITLRIALEGDSPGLFVQLHLTSFRHAQIPLDAGRVERCRWRAFDRA